ncbi:hypothetical protein [Cytobacillus pseudoceanisediminis]|uniref:hypothetical protein n=1 Tax=Cytobacillus pseudoceanisediminis TaxID=3051614 RepID=UPI003C306884
MRKLARDCFEEIQVCVKRGEGSSKKQLIALKRRNCAKPDGDCKEEIPVCVKRGEESAKKTVNCAETKELRLAGPGIAPKRFRYASKEEKRAPEKQLIALKRRNCAKPIEECAENIPVCVKRGEESTKKAVNCAETKELRQAGRGLRRRDSSIKRGEESTKKAVNCLKRRNCAKPAGDCAEEIPVCVKRGEESAKKAVNCAETKAKKAEECANKIQVCPKREIA